MQDARRGGLWDTRVESIVRSDFRIEIGVDDRSAPARIFYIFYPDWNLPSNDLRGCKYSVCRETALTDLLHSKWMHDFAPVVGQLGCLVRGDDGDNSCRRDFSWIGRKYAIYFFPYLQLGRFQSDCQQRGQQVCIPSSNLV